VVQSPISGELVSSITGQGAFKENLVTGAKDRLSTKDNGDKLNIFATSFPFRHPEYIDGHMELVKKLFGIFEDVRRVGSASLDLTWVSSGVWSAFIERFLKPWDVAAGGLFVVEAGGIITDFSGDSKNWLTNGEILGCSSARVHEQIMTLIE
jgi:myo-inositol-1(or 4)-monophosphatase